MRKTLALTTLGFILLLTLAPVASAHKTAYSADDKVKIVWGFLNEPAITMTKTGLDLILSDNLTGTPLVGVEKTLNASLVYNDQVHKLADFKAQHGQVGRYTDVVTLTKPGVYSLRLQGTINGTAVDMTIPGAHEIHALDETYFPDFTPVTGDDLAALHNQITDLQGEVAALKATAKTASESSSPVVKTDAKSDVPGFGALAALGAVGLVVLLRRRSA